MEDVLDLYEEEYDPQYPTVCLDEKPVVLHADVQPPVPVEPGSRSGWITSTNAEARAICSCGGTIGGLAACGSDRATHDARLCQGRALAGR